MNKILFTESRIITVVCYAFTLGLFLIIGIENASAISNNQSYKPVPENPTKSNLYGYSLTQWMMLHQAWYLQGQDPQTGTIGRVKLLPLPQQVSTPIPPDLPVGAYSIGSLDIALKSGSPFVAPVITLNGESYVNNILPPDEPIDLFKNSLLSADITVTLDGKIILQSPADNQKFFYGPSYFPEPITYSPPQFRFNDTALGDVFAAAAIWSQGIGFVHSPLKVGKHTLNIIAVNKELGYGFDNTWNITVPPNKGKH
jgi:hypothetical protein